MRPLGLSIVGCGRFATFHARAARRLGARVRLSFASRDLARAEAYRRRFGGVAAYDSYEAAAADAAVDVLVFCTPHDLHHDNVLLAARHGKAALLEKPIARTLEEADGLIEAARRAGIPLMVAENFHFMPAFRAVRALLRAGTIGEVRQIVISARGHWTPRAWRREQSRTGGGNLIDGGIHYVHLLRDWAGEIAEVSAAAPPNLVTEMEGEDTAFLLARFHGGAVGMLASSIAAPGLPRLSWSWVTGSRGTLAVDTRGRGLWLRHPGGTRRRLFLRDRRGLKAQLALFLEAVATGAAVPLPPESTRRDLAVVLAAYRAIATRAVVAVDTLAERG